MKEKILKYARGFFKYYCKVIHNYKDWYHTELLCDYLQSFYYGIIKNKDDHPYKKLIINIPPRHYKTRTINLFVTWVLGNYPKTTKIIYASYSKDLSDRFSRFARDEIRQEKNPTRFVYSDIFDVGLKDDNQSVEEWAVKDSVLSFKSVSATSAVTGIGGNILIIDDLVKDAEEANNDRALDKKWEWYVDTFQSRKETGAIEIIIMTRWSENDICGRLLKGRTPEKTVNIKNGKINYYDDIIEIGLEAWTDKYGILCEDMMTEKEYIEKRTLAYKNDPTIFLANYHNNLIEKTGVLYTKGFLTYSELPKTIHRRLAVCDVADSGNDYLSMIFGVVYNHTFYVTDILYTQDPQEKTEITIPRKIIENQIKDVIFEGNNGGKAFLRNIMKETQKLGYNSCSFNYFDQKKNKESRILTNATNVQDRILYPEDWIYRFPKFYEAMRKFKKIFKDNKNDDAPDNATMVIEYMSASGTPIRQYHNDYI